MTKTEPDTTARRNGKGNSAVHRSLRGSATRIQLANRKVAKAQAGKRAEWQDEGFLYFDDVGIVKSVIRFRADLMAKLRIFAAVRPLDDPEGPPIPVTDPESGVSADLARRAQEEIRRIRGESGGTPEILRLIDMNLSIAGEGYIVGLGPRLRVEHDDQTGEDVEILTLESWDVRSILEVEIEDGKYKVAHPITGEKHRLDPSLGDVCVRFWTRHPGRAKQPDCHLRSVLGDCESLVLLTNEVKAESKSRQNNNLLFVPNTMTVTTPTRTSPAEDDLDADAIDLPPDDEAEPAATSIGEVLEDAFLEPIEDPASPWSVLPVIITGPTEDGEKIRYIELNRKASEHLEARIEARKRAIAQGLPMPIEVAEGHMATTFANAGQIDEDIFEKYLEPSAVILADMWTIGLLQPALMDGGAGAGAERIICWYDPKDLFHQVDPAEHVKEALGLDLISDEAARRLWNLSEDDAPESIDRLIRAILRQQAWDPSLVDAVISALDPSLEVEASSEEPAVALVASLAKLRADGLGSQARSEVLVDLLRYKDQALRASAAQPRSPALVVSEKLGAADRDLFTKTAAIANAAMSTCLTRAGNRLRAKAKPGPLRDALRGNMVAPIYAAQAMIAMLGPDALAAAGQSEHDLIDADAFDAAVDQFHRDAQHTQAAALALAATLAGLSAARRKQLAARQAQHLNDADEWMRGELHDLAAERLTRPDAPEPAVGEFDPSARVPPGLVRYAMAVAGGATALEMVQTIGSDRYVALSNQAPPGGIGTGELIREAITGEGTVVIEGYEWDYGSGFRHRPYEPHEELDGVVVESPVDFGEDDFGLARPQNHDGCQCEPLIPVYAEVPSATEGPAPTAADLFGEGD